MMKRDLELFGYIHDEQERQIDGIELIASENYVSDQVLEALGSVCTNKYAEGYPGKRYYGGCENIDKIERLAIDRLKTLFGAEYVNVQPHSGAQANMAVMTAILSPGDTFMGLSLSCGGHLTHGSPVNISGMIYNPIPYGLDENGYIDYDEMKRLANEQHPKLIIGGASAYSREWDYVRMRKIADDIGAILWIDMAHTAGPIAAELLDNPVKYAHIVTSTTHKTLRGPRGGVILIGQDFSDPLHRVDSKGNIKMMSQIIDSQVFPGIQGGPLENVIAAKAISFFEALQPEFKQYQERVLNNAKVLCKHFIDKGYTVVSGGTDNHLFLLDLRSKFPNLSGKVAERELQRAEITLNKNMVPNDSRSPFLTSGLRIGTPAITTRDFNETDMKTIADLIDEVLESCSKHFKDGMKHTEPIMDSEHLSVLNSVTSKVLGLTSQKPPFLND